MVEEDNVENMLTLKKNNSHAATMENGVVGPQNFNVELPVEFTSRGIPRGIEGRDPDGELYTSIYST